MSLLNIVPLSVFLYQRNSFHSMVASNFSSLNLLRQDKLPVKISYFKTLHQDNIQHEITYVLSSYFSYFSLPSVEKDESVSRSYLSELQNITLRLNETEQRLMRRIQTPPPSRLSGDSTDNTIQIAEQEVSLSLICWQQWAVKLFI